MTWYVGLTMFPSSCSQATLLGPQGLCFSPLQLIDVQSRKTKNLDKQWFKTLHKHCVGNLKDLEQAEAAAKKRSIFHKLNRRTLAINRMISVLVKLQPLLQFQTQQFPRALRRWVSKSSVLVRSRDAIIMYDRNKKFCKVVTSDPFLIHRKFTSWHRRFWRHFPPTVSSF